MEGSSDSGSKIKDERSDEDDITIVEDEGDKSEQTEAGTSNKGASRKHKKSADDGAQPQSTDSGSNVFDYNMQGVLDGDMSPLESRQDSHGTNVDSDMAGFHASMDHVIDQGGWSWNKDSEVPHGSRDGMPPTKVAIKVRRFQCGICGTNFTLLKNAKRHYRCQHLNYYYWCKYCPNGSENRRYTRREFLEDHFLSQHPNIACEVEETGKSVPTDEYNILHVDLYEDEEEEEEVGVELVTTTDANLPGRPALESASSRVPSEGSLLLQHAEQRRDSNARCNFINLADYHGFANESHPQGSTVSGSSQKRAQRISPVNEVSKVRRIDNERNANVESGMAYSDEMLHDVSQSVPRWVSPSGSGTQVNLTAPNHSALPSSRSQSNRHDGSYSSHVAMHTPSASTHDCLVIGSAITPVDPSQTPSPPVIPPTNQHASSQIGSSSSRPPPGQSSMVQSTHNHLPKRPNHVLPEQQHSKRERAGYGRNVAEDGSISSSGGTSHHKHRGMGQHHSKSKEVIVLEGDAPPATSLSCKEIFEKYHDNIGKYSKETDYKYDSSGRVVRRKIVKHVFVFGKSKEDETEKEPAEVQTAERSASR